MRAGVFKLGGHHNHAGAGAPGGNSGGGKGGNRFDQAVEVEEVSKGRALATGHDQCVKTFQVLRQAHLAGGDVQLFEKSDVPGKIALDCDHADGEHRFLQWR